MEYTSSTSAAPTRSFCKLPVLLWPSKTLLMFSSFLPAQRVRELLLSLLTTPSLLPLPDVSLLVPSPIRSRLLSVSLGSCSLWIPVLTTSQLLKPHMSTSQSLPCATLTPHSAMLILPFPATTRLPTRSVLCSTCWPVKSSVCAESSPAIWNGPSWPICSSTAIPRISKRRRSLNNNKLLPPSRLLPKSTSKRTGPNPLLRAPTGLMKHQPPPLLLPLPSLSLPGKIGPALLLMTGAHLLLPPPVTGVLLPLPTGLKKANFSCYL